jgi:2-methylcitrate dehydratase PrpD
VTLQDGTVLEENRAHPRGGLEDPLPPAEIEEKFRANARLALPMEKVEAARDAVKRLEQLPSIKILTEQLIPGKRGSAGT